MGSEERGRNTEIMMSYLQSMGITIYRFAAKNKEEEITP